MSARRDVPLMVNQDKIFGYATPPMTAFFDLIYGMIHTRTTDSEGSQILQDGKLDGTRMRRYPLRRPASQQMALRSAGSVSDLWAEWPRTFKVGCGRDAV